MSWNQFIFRTWVVLSAIWVLGVLSMPWWAVHILGKRLEHGGMTLKGFLMAGSVGPLFLAILASVAALILGRPNN